MKTEDVPIYFFVPEDPEGKGFPVDTEDYWDWLCGVEAVIRWDGRFSWTLQTYLQLKACGVNVQLAQQLPPEGIIVAHRDFLPDSVLPNDKTVLVVLKPDRMPHPFAQIHVVQAESDPLLESKQTKYSNTFVMPLWPQPGLIKRSNSRGDVFSNVSYMGRIEHLACDLRSESWTQCLQEELNIEWKVKEFSQWHNYSDVDAIVAVRSLGDERSKACGTTDDISMKPFSKLTNAWLAGIPAILGPEPSYQNLRQSSLDYIEAQSMTDVLDALRLLQQNKALREAMVDNGKARSSMLSINSLRLRWRELLFEKCLGVYSSWTRAEYRREFFEYRKTQIASSKPNVIWPLIKPASVIDGETKQCC